MGITSMPLFKGGDLATQRNLVLHQLRGGIHPIAIRAAQIDQVVKPLVLNFRAGGKMTKPIGQLRVGLSKRFNRPDDLVIKLSLPSK